MNQETQGLSKQQIKSRETRAKIFQAAKRILQKQGYDSAQTGDPLFIRNDKLQTYVPLTAATLEEALRG